MRKSFLNYKQIEIIYTHKRNLSIALGVDKTCEIDIFNIILNLNAYLNTT